MNKLPFLFVLVALSGSLWAAEPPRQNLNINREWKFKPGDYPGAEASAFDDAAWAAINLPHSFSIPYFQYKDFYVGYGWYRKHLDIKPEWASKRIFVEFEGAFQDAEVYMNGTRLGEHKGGFTGFSMDITPAIHPGDNVLAVRLNNNWNARIEPRSGDHTFMGGIYRNVHLVVTDPLHVTWYGTFVTTPEVSNNAATVDVKTEIANEGAASKNCVLTTDILDPDGKPVARLSSTQPIEAGATVTIDQTSPAIPTPKLWHPAHPFLYTAVTTVSDGATPVDDYQTTFGIRSIKWTADQGFFINGEHYYFHGANVHQDHAGWGDAIADSGAWRDVKLVKDAGLDFIRGSHYPHHPAFADACDKLGVLFWSENCFWGMGRGKKEQSWMTSDAYPPNADDQAPFEQNALETLRDEIRIFRNHPSIIVWSMCNEVFFSDNLDKVKGLLTKLVDETHQLDPTRPAAIGGCQRGGLDKLGDVAGYNGDGARIPEFQNPGIASAVSEYGSHISDRGDGRSDTYDGMFNNGDLSAKTPEYPWRSGQSLWCAFDYSTVLGHFGCMGFVDYFRVPKRSWYWYRNQYLHIQPPEWPKNGTPAKLSLTADKTTIEGADATDDCQLLVTVQDADGKPISNSPPVTFTIESGPGEFPTGRSITFNPPSSDPKSDIAIRDGMAAIEFRSYYGGQSVIRATSPGLEDGTVTITTVGDPRFVPGQTPSAPDRPYVRFAQSASPESGSQNVALNHPASASSEASGHTAGLAIDGNVNTGWQAADGNANAWWQVDLEGFYSIQSVETTFGDKGNYQYRIEASADGAAWTLLADQTRTTSADKVRTDTCAKNERNRYLRLTLTGLPADHPALVEEIKIQGKPAP
jgi:beta-galactosidase